MTQSHREHLTKRFLTLLRCTFALFWLGSAVLGYFGLRTYLESKSGDASAPNVLYNELALISVQQLPPPGRMTWPLQVGRFASPAILLYTVLEIGLALSAERIRAALHRRARNHVVICGTTRAADTLADQLRAAGKRVITIEPTLRRRESMSVVEGDPTSARVLHDAAVHRADCVYACLERSEDNASVIMAVDRMQARWGRPLKLYALIHDLDLCAALRARQWSASASGAHHLDFFNLDELAARAVVRRDHEAFDDGPPQIAVVGTGAFARSIIVEFGRQWLVRRGTSRAVMSAALIGADAPKAVSNLCDRYAFLGEACRIEPRTESLDRFLALHRGGVGGTGGAVRVRRLYLCQSDENEALKTALTSAAFLRTTVGVVVVRLERMVGLASGFRPGPDGAALLDAYGGRLRLVDVIEEGCDPERIGEDLTEELARACHEHYVAERFAAGSAPDSAAALVRWEELPDDFRCANRDLAVDVGRKLASIDCLLSPRAAGEPKFAYRGDEIERLAGQEHARWVAERRRSGWTYGPRRDNSARRHPALLPWAELPEEQREKDRQAVRAYPEILAAAGLVVVRLNGSNGPAGPTNPDVTDPSIPPGAPGTPDAALEGAKAGPRTPPPRAGSHPATGSRTGGRLRARRR